MYACMHVRITELAENTHFRVSITFTLHTSENLARARSIEIVTYPCAYQYAENLASAALAHEYLCHVITPKIGHS